MKLPLSEIVGRTFSDTVHHDKAMVLAFHPSSRMFELCGKYPGGLTDNWLTPNLLEYGIEPEFSQEELDRLDELRTTNLVAANADELRRSIEQWFSAPHLR